MPGECDLDCHRPERASERESKGASQRAEMATAREGASMSDGVSNLEEKMDCSIGNISLCQLKERVEFA